MSGRHPLPTGRPPAVDTAQQPSHNIQVPNTTPSRSPYAVSSAPEPNSVGAIPQNHTEAAAAPQSAAMERQASKPYINNTTAPPYRDEAEAFKHQLATIAEVKRQIQRALTLGPQPTSSSLQSRVEAVLALVQLRASSDVQTQAPPATVQPSEAQGFSRPGQAGNTASSPPQSPEEEAAWILVRMKTSSNTQTQAPPAMVRPEPNHQSRNARAQPQCPTTQEHVQQESQESRATGEDDGHTGRPASSELANPRSRRPPAQSKPQPKQKRKGDEGTEGEEPETKKPAKAKGGKPKEEQPRPFVCPCGSTFRRNEHLTRHQKCKHGRVRFECDICRNLFTRRDNLGQHRSLKHPKAGPAPEPRSLNVGLNGTMVDAPATSPALVTTNGEAQPGEEQAQPDNEHTQDTSNSAQPGDEDIQHGGSSESAAQLDVDDHLGLVPIQEDQC